MTVMPHMLEGSFLGSGSAGSRPLRAVAHGQGCLAQSSLVIRSIGVEAFCQMLRMRHPGLPSELFELGVWARDADLLLTEVDPDCDPRLNLGHRSEAVLIVCDAVVDRELLERGSGHLHIEGTGREGTAGSAHTPKYAPDYF